MKFEYFQTVTMNNELDIEDIGQCAIMTTTDVGICNLMIIDTYLGVSRIFTYGPFNPEFEERINTYVSVRYADYSEYFLIKTIKNFINVQGITQAQCIDRDDAINMCKDITECLQNKEF